jgi:EAL domain-containing protein (putative c-di-GMP-specific phosphodiesterase class I)
MYHAKLRGGDGFDVFNEALRNRALHRLTTESDLRRAIAHHELRLVYQPIIDLTHNRISGVEALLRWSHPTRGLLGPAEFLPIAEDSSLIVPIGNWVLNEACAQARAWSDPVAGPPLTMAINVSLRQLLSGTFERTLDQALTDSGTAPQQIHLEITETVLLQSTHSVKSQLAVASDHGVCVGLDDFGTGYSSLSLIRDFPVRFLKIDQTFIHGLGVDRGDSAITGAVIKLSRTLGMDAIAEGIETGDQLRILQELGCGYAQGYYLARPQPAADIQGLLDRGPVWIRGLLDEGSIC